ncbi:hypothetical protein EIN_274170 [Entamoeba invadens IP1]|uniref:Uncharacterized protein n=1 Tax=Entamoeba invadens IP1 TaxID=370355 RepID=A0A0A1U1E7_ENTIV|nr:hypothetical protein EIN_274170 [Entamoeba invadens IP1]ELP87850.1 hypothetical protein EIN_274170 [Entamoeba invadens IP1]|eukprot:XP_004254621.1 hypothetical protein EIN_274170 [Entamoeba invadens IP1]
MVYKTLARPDLYLRGALCFFTHFFNTENVAQMRKNDFCQTISALLIGIEHTPYKCDVEVLTDFFKVLRKMSQRSVGKEFYSRSDLYTKMFTFHLVLLSIFTKALCFKEVENVIEQITATYKYPFLVAVCKGKTYSTLYDLINARLKVRNPLLTVNTHTNNEEDVLLKLLKAIFESLSGWMGNLPECTNAYSDEILIHTKVLGRVDLSSSVKCMTTFVQLTLNTTLENEKCQLEIERKAVDYVDLKDISAIRINESGIKETMAHKQIVFEKLQTAFVTQKEWFDGVQYLSLFYHVFLNKALRAKANVITVLLNTCMPLETLKDEWKKVREFVQQKTTLTNFEIFSYERTPRISTVFPLFSNVFYNFAEDAKKRKDPKNAVSAATEQEKVLCECFGKVTKMGDAALVEMLRMYEGYIAVLKKESGETLKNFLSLFDKKQIDTCTTKVKSGKETVELISMCVQGTIAFGCKQAAVRDLNERVVKLWRLLNREEVIRNVIFKIFKDKDNTESYSWDVRMKCAEAIFKSLEMRNLIYLDNDILLQETVENVVKGIGNVEFVYSIQKDCYSSILEKVPYVLERFSNVLKIPAATNVFIQFAFPQKKDFDVEKYFKNEIIKTYSTDLPNVCLMEKIYRLALVGKEPDYATRKTLFLSSNFRPISCLKCTLVPAIFRNVDFYNHERLEISTMTKTFALLPTELKISYLAHNTCYIHNEPKLFFENINFFDMKTIEKITLEITTSSSVYFKFVDYYQNPPICDFSEVFDFLCQEQNLIFKKSKESGAKIEAERAPFEFSVKIARGLVEANLDQVCAYAAEIAPNLTFFPIMIDKIEEYRKLSGGRNENTEDAKKIQKVLFGILSKMTNKNQRTFIDQLSVKSVVLLAPLFTMIRLVLKTQVTQLPIFENNTNQIMKLDDQKEFADKLLLNDFWDFCEVNSFESALKICISLLSQLGYVIEQNTTLDNAIEDYVAHKV